MEGRAAALGGRIKYCSDKVGWCFYIEPLLTFVFFTKITYKRERGLMQHIDIIQGSKHFCTLSGGQRDAEHLRSIMHMAPRKSLIFLSKMLNSNSKCFSY